MRGGATEAEPRRRTEPNRRVSDLHRAPGFSVQLALQQRSELMFSSPGSHSSPCSTRELPHTLVFRSLKQNRALVFRRFRMERLLQFEKSWTHATLSSVLVLRK